MKAAVLNLGCKVNHYETEGVRQQLQQAGFAIVPFKEQADVYVINTCTVTGEAARKSRQMVRRAKQTNADALVVAVGCDVEFEGNRVGADLAIGNVGKATLVQQIQQALTEKSPETRGLIEALSVDQQTQFEDFGAVVDQADTRAIVKVQDGCNQFCSYCAIPYARGRVRSRSIESVIAEVKGLVANGFKEIVVTGIHVCSYGQEWQSGDLPLMDLCDALSAIEGLVRIRLGSIEPKSVTPMFAQRMSQNTKLCHHVHLSLQSGSDAVLKMMRRRYTAAEYEAAVCALREAMPDLTLTTDVIVGFPTETAEQHAESLAFCERIGFHKIHVFKFSPREGTVAAKLPQRIPSMEMDRRSKDFIQLAEKSADQLASRLIGSQQTVILEQEKMEGDGQWFWRGYTAGYLPVAVFDQPHFCTGMVVQVQVNAYRDGLLWCV